jgi:ATP-dependent RNA helicase RhlE
MRHSVQELFECLRDAGHAAGTIHGDREQPQREAALAAFKAGRTPLLVSVERCPRHASHSQCALILGTHAPLSADLMGAGRWRRTWRRAGCTSPEWST